jgi:hypothetical protein
MWGTGCRSPLCSWAILSSRRFFQIGATFENSVSSNSDKEAPMPNLRVAVFSASLLLAGVITVACGSNSNINGRRLLSISVAQTVNGDQIQFVATGTFSSPPTTVTPLPVNWSEGLFAPPPPGNLDYSLSAQAYTLTCTAGQPFLVNALAPPNPSAPANGSLPLSQFVVGTATGDCP